MIIQGWTETTFNSFQALWNGLISFLPALIGALLILLVGLIVAAGLRLLVERIIASIKLDTLLKKVGLGAYTDRAGVQLNSGKFLGFLVYWFLVIVFALAATDILKLWGVSLFLRDVISYIPNILVAILIMLAAVLLANLSKSVVKSSVASARLHASKFLGTLAWWVVVVFGLLAALLQLGIAAAIINTLITGLIAMIAIAGGIAFGLGGKDLAASLLEKLKREVEEK